MPWLEEPNQVTSKYTNFVLEDVCKCQSFQEGEVELPFQPVAYWKWLPST